MFFEHFLNQGGKLYYEKDFGSFGFVHHFIWMFG